MGLLDLGLPVALHPKRSAAEVGYALCHEMQS